MSRRVLRPRRWLRWRARFSLPALLARADERVVVSAVTAIHGGLSILMIGVLAWLSDLPLLFPALGPTAFLLFSAPLSLAAAPRSVVLSHLVAIVCGRSVLQLMSGLAGTAVSLEVGGWPVFCGASAALALTGLLLVRFALPHPPACASALVVAVGGVTDWDELLMMSVAIVLLTGQATFINRVAGLPVPTWRPHEDRDESVLVDSAGPFDSESRRVSVPSQRQKPR